MPTSPCSLSFVRASLTTLLVALSTAGCLEVRDSEPNPSRKCTACHGDATRSTDPVLNAAPPFDTDGNTQVSAPGVGAHQLHLGGDGHAKVACTECHVVPEEVQSKGHIDHPFPATLTFGALAKQGGNSPQYDSKTHRCSNSYCHGKADATWNAPRDAQVACGTCHTLPPAAPHPQLQDCSQCHGDVIASDRTFKRPDLHVNGKVDVKLGGSCDGCHGTGPQGAPPPDLSRSSDPASPGAGAHATHLVAGATHGAVACNQCHVVPQTVDQPSHIDGDNRAEITFGTLAQSNNSSPAYARSDQSCANVYCHGAVTPKWTNPRSSDQACGSCHSLPPSLPHPQNSDCSQCHSGVIGPDRTFTHPELHVDGTVELDTKPTCSACHGTGQDGAPPPDLSGNMDVSSRGVGAHQIHLSNAATHGKLTCSECHVVPATVDAPGHLGTDGRAEITFGTLAQHGGSSPTYDSTSVACQNTYCHGTVSGKWQTPRASDAACGSCHSLPPAAPHPPRQDCENCHGDVIGPNRVFIAPSRHVDGNVDVAAGCNTCHGSSSNAAPPRDISGSNDPTRIGVGAHQTHLSGGKFGRPVACSDCHVVPKAVSDPGHIDGWTNATVTFGGAAIAGVTTPVWNRTTATCTGSYCHDPSTTGNTPPTWTTSGVVFTCTSCHQMPPPAPHNNFTQCSFCHTNVDAQYNIKNRALHVNGVVDF